MLTEPLQTHFSRLVALDLEVRALQAEREALMDEIRDAMAEEPLYSN